MNVVQCLASERSYPAIPPQSFLIHEDENSPLRVGVFGSFQGGMCLLKVLLGEPFLGRVKVVGVATDDPTAPFTHAAVRLWKYPHSLDDEVLVRRFAQGQGIPVWTGRVKSEAFIELFTRQWTPELCLMATFGQKIPSQIFCVPELGFYNFHHSDLTWPSYPGPDPIAAMLKDGKKEVVITMHEVTDLIDGGRFIARSKRFPLQVKNAMELHRITWPQMGPFIHDQVERFIALRKARPCA
jgi:methionyl-tRNA formyltransferase